MTAALALIQNDFLFPWQDLFHGFQVEPRLTGAWRGAEGLLTRDETSGIAIGPVYAAEIVRGGSLQAGLSIAAC